MSSGTEALQTAVEEYFQTAEKPQPYSAADYFSMIIGKALETRRAGNYGIAAAYILRINGFELIFFGQNELITANNPHGHAEMDAVQQARKLFNCKGQDEANTMAQALTDDGRLFIRPAQKNKTESLVVTTLEPCPMCTVGSVINTKINQVIIATADPPSGQLLQGRLDALAEIWPKMAKNQNLEIMVCQNDNPSSQENYVNPAMQDLLNRLFFEHREPMDEILEKEGFFRYDSVIVAAAAQFILDQAKQ